MVEYQERSVTEGLLKLCCELYGRTWSRNDLGMVGVLHHGYIRRGGWGGNDCRCRSRDEQCTDVVNLHFESPSSIDVSQRS
jgi:hypothetical protein